MLAAYVRDVTAGTPRTSALSRVGDEFTEAGSRMLVVPDTTAAARDALESGWIAEAALAQVAQEKEQDAQ